MCYKNITYFGAIVSVICYQRFDCKISMNLNVQVDLQYETSMI